MSAFQKNRAGEKKKKKNYKPDRAAAASLPTPPACVPAEKRKRITSPCAAGSRTGSRRGCRDRVVHLLALRPYKKLEILARLWKDGVSTKALWSILQQVANRNRKANCYTLKESLYWEVNRNWPGYSEDERKQLEHILARKLESLASSSRKERCLTLQKEDSFDPSPKLSFKCLSWPEELRLSALGHRGGPREEEPTPPILCPPSADLAEEPPASVDQREGLGSKEGGASTGPGTSRSNEGTEKGGDDHTEVSSAVPVDYLQKYAPIACAAQRRRYAADFWAERGEYAALRPLVDAATRRFRQLHGQLRRLEPGTREHCAVYDEVWREYNHLKQSTPTYPEVQKRCRYLHDKLAHIQTQIARFDRRRIWTSQFRLVDKRPPASHSFPARPSSAGPARHFHP